MIQIMHKRLQTRKNLYITVRYQKKKKKIIMITVFKMLILLSLYNNLNSDIIILIMKT